VDAGLPSASDRPFPKEKSFRIFEHSLLSIPSLSPTLGSALDTTQWLVDSCGIVPYNENPHIEELFSATL
jgi:hypothetical protein